MEPEANTSKAASVALSKSAAGTSKAASVGLPSLGPCPALPAVPVKAPPFNGPVLAPAFHPVPVMPAKFEVIPGGCIGTKMPPPQPQFVPLQPPMLGPCAGPLGPPGPPQEMARPPTDLPPAGLLAAVDAAVARAGVKPEHEPAEKVEWEAHKSPQGLPYFFCKKTGESRWTKPSGAYDVILEAGAKQPQPAKAAAPAATTTSMKDKIGEPESWETIGKTGWTRVQTDKGFTYFYHKKQKKTAWTCPPEIERDVAELDGCLGAFDEEVPDENKDKKEEDPESAADVSKDEQGEVPGKPSKAERAERRAQQVEEEQKIAKDKEKIRNFKQLLLEKGVKAFDKYEKWLPKLVHDPRFTAVTVQKERKLLFEMLAKRIDSEKRKTQAVSKLKGREAFKELISRADELELLHGRTAEKALSAMERRFGDDERWDAVPDHDKERMVKEAVEEATKRVEKQKDEARVAFRALVLKTLNGLKSKEGKDGKEAERFDPPAFSKMRRHFEDDPCWPHLSSSEREGIYNRIVRELDEARRKQRAKQREIQMEVEAARKKRKLTEIEERVCSVLAERLKNPFSLTWEEARQLISVPFAKLPWNLTTKTFDNTNQTMRNK